MRASACAAFAVLTAAGAFAGPALAQEAQVAIPAETVRTFDIPEADQGIAVDDQYFYVVDNQLIHKFDKATGQMVGGWDGDEDGPIVHLDSAVVVNGKIYSAHSNYPTWPMTSSVEIWDAATMQHIGSHSFGIEIGSLTWLDYYDGSWWGGFANYNIVNGRDQFAYGNKYNTQIVQFDDQWRVIQAWVLPDALLAKFDDMSNSGGSWGPDGHLWLSGHDPAEVYQMDLPESGSILKWVGTAQVGIAGQGIAWDRSEPGTLYGINRAGDQVIVSHIDTATTPDADAPAPNAPATNAPVAP